MQHHAIVPVTETGLHILADLERSTFAETFADAYTPADLEAFLREKKSPEAIQKEWAAEDSRYFLLFVEKTAAGFIKLNLHHRPEGAHQLPGPFLELEKIYVAKAYQHLKLGYALLQYTLGFATENGAATVWLGVWEHNARAIAFYERAGFQTFGEHSFTVGSQTDRDLLMAKILRG
ncbi:GNAT family N-acetyltransferase [Chitinophaga lutea]